MPSILFSAAKVLKNSASAFEKQKKNANSFAFYHFNRIFVHKKRRKRSP
jgi:hypothetical protein